MTHPCSSASLCALVAGIASTGLFNPAHAGTPLEDPIPGAIETGEVSARLITIADGLTAPNWGAVAPGIDDRLFVVDQTGQVWNIDLTTGDRSLFLDVSADLVPLGISGPGSFDERGLLGLAFHPEYNTPGTPGFGLFYTYESHPLDGEADFSTMPPGTSANHQSVIIERSVSNPDNPDATPDAGPGRELLRIDEPQFNHDGGCLAFSPVDGYLYISLGDGGAGDDQGPGHAPNGNGQTPSNILGSIVRIDPLGTDSENGAYGIPPSNPFVGDPEALDEIFAYGLRNPFRMSFDRDTGALWLGDAGQNDIEEVDIVAAGDNLGWPVKEGTFLFNNNGSMSGFVTADSPGVPADMTDPVLQYDHDEGIAVIGGFVQRGGIHPGLQGRYVFGDYRRPGGPGRIFHALAGGEIEELGVGDAITGPEYRVLGFGEDTDGNIYVMVNSTGVPSGDTGAVLLIAPDCPADLARPFGSLDFDDLDAFIAAFQAEDPAADLAVPTGLFDLADIVAFVTAFNAGCP